MAAETITSDQGRLLGMATFHVSSLLSELNGKLPPVARHEVLLMLATADARFAAGARSDAVAILHVLLDELLVWRSKNLQHVIHGHPDGVNLPAAHIPILRGSS